jgi:aryl-alcohol dehydrogenase-like predicted oxidoreductase
MLEVPNALRLTRLCAQNGIESLPKSLFGHKILSEAYLREADYANVIATAEKGKSLIKALDIETGLKFHG